MVATITKRSEPLSRWHGRPSGGQLMGRAKAVTAKMRLDALQFGWLATNTMIRTYLKIV
jgi:hypothetical protein